MQCLSSSIASTALFIVITSSNAEDLPYAKPDADEPLAKEFSLAKAAEFPQ